MTILRSPRLDGTTARDIPDATVARLPVYLRALNALAELGVLSCASNELAEQAGVNPAKLRKDLSYLGSYGTRGVGYDVEYLRYQIAREIGVTQDWPVVIVGIGNLGHALANYSGFSSRGFRIVALLDADPEANLVEGMEWGAEHPVAGRLRLVALPVTLTETPGRVYSPPPRLGDDNAAILEEIGYSLDDTLDLFDAGVLGGERPPEEG